MTSARQPDAGKAERRQKERRDGESLPAIPASVTDIAGWMSFFRGLTYLRYLVVSVGALAVDMGVFLGLLGMGMMSVAASAVGYTVGIVAHWLLSSRKVFHGRVSDKGTAERTQQKAMFLVSALIGLATTMAIVGVGDGMGFDPRLAKLVAIGFSFQLTYMLRNIIIFRPAKAGK
jgi:putative flippase GtrA